MTAHTTPRMIIIYKKKVTRKKKRKSGFHMKDINPSIYLLLLKRLIPHTFTSCKNSLQQTC